MEKIKISAQTLAELLQTFEDGILKDVFIKNLLIDLSDDDKIKLKKAIQDTKQLSLF
jgi:hypothetical protein